MALPTDARPPPPSASRAAILELPKPSPFTSLTAPCGQPPPQHGQPPLSPPPSRPLLAMERRAGNGGGAAPSQGAAGRGPRPGAGRGRPLGPPPPPHSAPGSRRRNFPPAVPAAAFPPRGSGEDSPSFPACLPACLPPSLPLPTGLLGESRHRGKLGEPFVGRGEHGVGLREGSAVGGSLSSR